MLDHFQTTTSIFDESTVKCTCYKVELYYDKMINFFDVSFFEQFSILLVFATFTELDTLFFENYSIKKRISLNIQNEHGEKNF